MRPRRRGPRAALLAASLAASLVVLGSCCAPTAARAAQTVTIGMQLEPPVLDPTANPAAAISEALYGNVFEGLVQLAGDGSVRPCLAASWDVSADGLSYTFHLRDGVRFHDGARFDADTAKYSLERALAPDSLNPQRSRIAAISAVQALDARTLRLSLRRRSGGLLQSLAWGAFVMVEPRSAAANATRPVGTGPFRFVEWRRGDALVLERNDDYWGGRARLGGVIFKFISDPTAAYAALMAGDVDAFSSYPAPENVPQFAADPRFKVFVGSTEAETVLALNNRRPPLSLLPVRRAIALALDRRALIDGAMFGYAAPIGSHFPPAWPGLHRSHGDVSARCGAGARAPGAGRLSAGLLGHAQAPAAELCTPRRRDRRRAARRGRHSRDHREPRVGAVARPGFHAP
jgi:peptide/nickel transport system substrate-binding protein